jgi:hypothetical protein
MARIVSCPAPLVCQVASKLPFEAAFMVATGTQLAPGVAGSWSISTAAPASLAGTLPLTDTPLRTNDDTAEEIVIPLLVALTVPVPGWTLGLVPEDDPVEAPPDPPAQANPGITRALAPAARRAAK